MSSSPLNAQMDRYLRHLAVERGLARNTLSSYGRDLDRYRRFLGSERIDDPADITAATVGRYAVWLGTQEGLASASVARAVVAVRGMHKFWAAEGVTLTDPAAGVTPPRAPRRLPSFLTVAQVQRLLTAAGGDDPVSIRDRALLEFLYGTGARISEAVALAVDDLGADERGYEEQLVRLHGKGSKDRLVPVGSYARAAIDAYLVRVRPAWASKGTGSPALFLGPRGDRMSRQSAWLVVKRRAAEAHIDTPMSPHTLRHTYATHLLQGGADVRVVQELLGHASVTTTQLYTHVTIDSLREVYATSHPRARWTDAEAAKP